MILPEDHGCVHNEFVGELIPEMAPPGLKLLYPDTILMTTGLAAVSSTVQQEAEEPCTHLPAYSLEGHLISSPTIISSRLYGCDELQDLSGGQTVPLGTFSQDNAVERP